jgi:hypothetical protein
MARAQCGSPLLPLEGLASLLVANVSNNNDLFMRFYTIGWAAMTQARKETFHKKAVAALPGQLQKKMKII